MKVELDFALKYIPPEWLAKQPTLNVHIGIPRFNYSGVVKTGRIDEACSVLALAGFHKVVVHANQNCRTYGFFREQDLIPAVNGGRKAPRIGSAVAVLKEYATVGRSRTMYLTDISAFVGVVATTVEDKNGADVRFTRQFKLRNLVVVVQHDDDDE